MTDMVASISPSAHGVMPVTQRSVREIMDAWQPKRGIKWGLIAARGSDVLFLVVILPLLWVVIRSFMSLPDGTHNQSGPSIGSTPVSIITSGS